MGKIADALGKYEKERKAFSHAGLTKADLSVLMAYDKKTGHLLSYDPGTGHVDPRSMEVLRNKGTIQRLLEKGLIFPGGKLTPNGLQECERLRNLIQTARPEAPAADQTRQKRAEKTNPSDAAAKPDQTTRSMPPTQVARASATGRPRAEETSRLQPRGGAAVVAVDDPQAVFQEPAVLQHKPAPRASAAEGGQKAAALDDDGAVSVPKASEISVDEKPGKLKGRGTVPETSYEESKADKNIVSLLDPHSYAAEQFKLLRTSILYPVAGLPPQSILVTSAMPDEGKSFVAANLAVSIALNINRYVLLIDCDLRKPDIHRKLGFGDVPGLSEYLKDRVELSSLLLKTGVEKLTLLPGGRPPSNPSELMSSEKMAGLLEEVKHRYHDRLIVIDSPPPGMASETGILARQVDGILLVSKHRKTPREDLEQLIERMGSDKIIGAVVNFSEARSSRYYRYQKYGNNGKR